MKPATHDVCVFIDDGVFIGICCGWDYTAEHEWGIKRMQEYLGIRYEEEGLFGLDRRKINNPPAHLVCRKINGITYLICRSSAPWREEDVNKPSAHEKECLHFYDYEGAADSVAAWDAENWAFATKDSEAGKHLKELAEALKKGDAAVYLGGMDDNPFKRNGLCVVIASRLPKQIVDDMYKVDENYHNLMQAVKATGIEEQLKEADCGYYALKPSWKTDIKREGLENSEHPVVFFLNPRDQQQYNFGWYTVEQLQEWARGEGPVIKSE